MAAKTIFFWVASLVVLPISNSVAQTSRVVPEFFTSVEGNDSSLRPFAANAFRMQMLVDGGELANTVAVLTDFSFRRDGTNANTPYAGRTITNLRVTLGSAARTPGTMSTAFATNRRGTQTVILNGTYNLPAQPTVRGVGPFNIVFKTGRPFVYPRANGDLLIEMSISGRNAIKVQYPVDAISAGRGTQTVREFGMKGPLAANPNYKVTNASPTRLQPGGSAVLDATGFSKAFPSLAVFGFSDKRFGPLPLPFDLAVLGAPRNRLHVSMDLVLPLVLARATATAPFAGSARTPIPAVREAAGLRLFGQAIFLDSASNTLGLVFSNGVEMTVTKSPISPFQMLWSDDSSATSGSFPLTSNGGLGGLVTKFGGRGFN